MAKVARVDDDLHVFVLRGDLAQDRDGFVLRGVVDEDVLVAVAADFLEDLFDLLVALADVLLLVVATADHTDEFFARGTGRAGGGGEAGGGAFHRWAVPS